ncbi:MAG: hypothetical protein ACOVLC_11730 [Flavobacterium sp.]
MKTNLFDTTILIPGVNFDLLMRLTNDIAADVFQESLETGTGNIKDSINYKLEYIKRNIKVLAQVSPKGEAFATNQLGLLEQNREKLFLIVNKKLKSLNYTIENRELDLEEMQNDNVEDETDVTINENSERNTWKDNAFYTIDPRLGITARVKGLLIGTKNYIKIPKGYQLDANYVGIPSYPGLDTVYNKLIDMFVFSNINYTQIQNYTFDEIIKIIEQNIDNSPFLIDVREKLNKYKNDEAFLNGFKTVLSKHHTSHIYVDRSEQDENGELFSSVKQSATMQVIDLIKAEWQVNLKKLDIIKYNSTIPGIKTHTIRKFNTLFSIIRYRDKIIPITYEELSSLLKMIGINLPIDVYNTMANRGIARNGRVMSIHDHFTMSDGIFRNIAQSLSRFQEKDLKQLDVTNNNILDNTAFNIFSDSSYTVLAHYLSKFRNDLFVLSHKNSNSDTVYGISNMKPLINRFEALINGKLNYLLETPFTQHSTWLDNLYGEYPNGERYFTESNLSRTLKYFTADGLKNRANKLAKTIDNLTPNEFEIFKFDLFINEGKKIGNKFITTTLFPIMGDKSTVFAIQHTRNHYVLQNNKLSENDYQTISRTLFLPELSRVLLHQTQDINTNHAEYEQGKQLLLTFPGLYEIAELFEDDAKTIIKKDIIDNYTKYEALTRPLLMSLINNEVFKTIEAWTNAKIIVEEQDNSDIFNPVTKKIIKTDKRYKKAFNPNTTPDIFGRTSSFNLNIQEVAVNYAVNQLLANLNFQQIFIGDPALFTKTSKTPMQTSIETFDNISKRLSMDNAGHTPIVAYSNETLNYLVLEDVKIKSYIYDTYLKNILSEKDLESYDNMNSTDAAEFVSLKEYLLIRHKEDAISKENMDKILKEYNENEKLSKASLKVLSDAIINAQKPVYGSNFYNNGIDYRLYVKSASMPLIAQFTQNTPLDELRLLLEGKHPTKQNGMKVDRIAFKSAVKIGAPSILPKWYNNETDTLSLPNNWNTGLITNVPRHGHGIQQPVPYDPDKDDQNDGTQHAKLLFNDLLDVGGFTDPITKEENLTGKELSEKYLAKYGEYFKLKYKQLLDELQYNPITKQIKNINKLSNILKEEGIARKYTENELYGFLINDSNTDFNIDLWLSTSDAKVASLLNAIVDNRVRKRKFKGKSFVLMPNVGNGLISQDSIGTIDGLIRINGHNGKLLSMREENGKIKYAQVYVPFKYVDNNGKALSIKDFTKVVDGKTILDESKLPDELRTFFAYRIPTQDLMSMANIEIVGFLPDTYGDIVIAPSDFVAQMGSNFEIDKLQTHMYNTILFEKTDEKGNIQKALRPITGTHLNKQNEVIIERGKIKHELNIAKGELAKNPESVLLKEKVNILTDTLNSYKDNMYLSSDLRNNKLKLKIIENDILRYKLAVLSNLTVELQEKRARPLSMGNLKELSKKIVIDDSTFNPLAASYQSALYQQSRSSKAAVGQFSLDSILNASLQYIENEVHFTYGTERININNEKVQDITNIYYNIAGVKSNALNNNLLSGKTKTKSAVISAFQSAALDDGKEKLLGKLNINKHTFDAIRALIQLGYDEDVVIAFINQPSVKQYVKQQESFTYEEKTYNKEERVINKNLLKTVSIEQMFDYAKENDFSDEFDNAVLMDFIDLTKKGKILKTLQQATNSDSAGVGKNLFYTRAKIESVYDMLNMIKDANISDVSGLLGNFFPIVESVDGYPENTVVTREDALEKVNNGDAIIMNNQLFVPTTISGFATAYGTVLTNDLFSRYFPYTTGNVLSILQDIILNSNVNLETVGAKAKALQSLSKDFKSAIISTTFHLLGNDTDIIEARKRLLYETSTNQSLETILTKIIQANRNKERGSYTNPLLEKLKLGNSQGFIANNEYPALNTAKIKYLSANTEEMDAEILVASFVDMIENVKDLSKFVGKQYTTKDLANDLILHQIVTGGIQEFGQFIKYVPNVYLEQLGYFKRIKAATNQIQSDQLIAAKINSRMAIQYAQHHPYEFLVDSEFITRAEDGLSIETDMKAMIIAIKQGTKYELYVNKQRVDLLGKKGEREYDLLSDNAKSIYFDNQVK